MATCVPPAQAALEARVPPGMLPEGGREGGREGSGQGDSLSPPVQLGWEGNSDTVGLPEVRGRSALALLSQLMPPSRLGEVLQPWHWGLSAASMG